MEDPHSRPGQPREHHQRLHHQDHRPREPVWDLGLCPDPPSAVILSPGGAGLISYPRRQQQVGHVYGFLVVKLFRLSSSSCCKKLYVDRVFMIAFLMMECPYSHTVHVHKAFILSGCSWLHIVHVVRVFLLTKYLKNCSSL